MNQIIIPTTRQINPIRGPLQSANLLGVLREHANHPLLPNIMRIDLVVPRPSRENMALAPCMQEDAKISASTA